LQGTDANSATSVYTETQKTNANANGLVSVEIGTGTSSDDFSAIDWGNGTYFIKTETDLNGGTDYTITGISQLLSVPFALFAKTAQKATETDPIFKSSVANEISATDTLNWNSKSEFSGNYIDLSNKPTVIDTAKVALKASGLVLKSSNGKYFELNIDDNGTITTTEINPNMGEFKDVRDGQIYNTIKIDNQVWMAENLNYFTPTNSSYYNNDSLTYHAYGRLYTIDGALNACPSGWHLPSDEDWQVLEGFLGVPTSELQNSGLRGSIEGGKLKLDGVQYWNSPNTGATNEVYFSALPAGNTDDGGDFTSIQNQAFFWTSTEKETDFYWARSLYFDSSKINRMEYFSGLFHSIRCIMD